MTEELNDSLLPAKKKSCWWSHDWGNWEVVEEGEIVSTIHRGIIGHYLYQQRTCKRCNKTELNKQETR